MRLVSICIYYATAYLLYTGLILHYKTKTGKRMWIEEVFHLYLLPYITYIMQVFTTDPFEFQHLCYLSKGNLFFRKIYSFGTYVSVEVRTVKILMLYGFFFNLHSRQRHYEHHTFIYILGYVWNSKSFHNIRVTLLA